MKTNYLALTVLAIFVTAAGFATESPKMNIITNEDEKILVAFESETPCPVEITVTNVDGVIVYYFESKSLCTESNQTFNLPDLGNGKFNVSLNYGGKSINRELTVSGNQIKVGHSVRVPEPFFSFKNDKLNISFLNIANKNVFLNVYKDGEHYTGFTLGKDVDIQKSVDFSMAKHGKYEIIVSDYFKEHYYTVNK